MRFAGRETEEQVVRAAARAWDTGKVTQLGNFQAAAALAQQEQQQQQGARRKGCGCAAASCFSEAAVPAGKGCNNNAVLQQC